MITGRSVSTIQRAIEALERDEIVRRELPRGAIVFRPGAPRKALREVADWVLGRKESRLLAKAAASLAGRQPAVPVTISSPEIRAAWPRALDAIVSRYHPAQVILFGSQGRGDAGPDSDVDLLVVFDHLDDRRERRIELKRLLRDAPFAKDVLVATPHDVAHPAPGTAIAEAAHEGLVVYER
jgi:predicted nucleotidyltransferase